MIFGIGVCTRLLPGAPNGARFMGMNLDHERALKERMHDTVQALASRDVSIDEYSIRGMRLCNSARDFYYSRFSESALNEIVELLPGAPVMRGHNYDSLPVGTFLSASIERAKDRPKRDSLEVEALYMLPNDDEGTRMRTRIDLGVQREVSAGWRCMGATCSVCNEHIYECPHVPGDIYRGAGIAEFEFSGVTNFLEGSMVFRGGQKGTSTFIPAGADGEAAAVAGAASRLVRQVGRDVAWDEIREMKRLGASDLELLPNRTRAAIAQHSRAAGWGLMCAEPGERANTQALAFPRSRYADPAAAKRWARENDFRADRLKTTDTEHVLEQFDESRAEPDSFEYVKVEDGIRARVCKRAKKQEERTRSAGERSIVEWVGGAPN